VIGIVPGKIITERRDLDLAIDNGEKQIDLGRDILKIAVIERHGRNGNIATGFVQGFGLKRGAIASTIGHDSHNICVVGATEADMAVAANRLSEIRGGFVVAERQGDCRDRPAGGRPDERSAL
jgi:adenine deaminase